MRLRQDRKEKKDRSIERYRKSLREGKREREKEKVEKEERQIIRKGNRLKETMTLIEIRPINLKKVFWL